MCRARSSAVGVGSESSSEPSESTSVSSEAHPVTRDESPGSHPVGPILGFTVGVSLTYKRRDGPHDTAQPGVNYTVSLHGCVHRGVEEQVEEGEAGREGVDEGVEEEGAGAGHGRGESGRVEGGEVAAD